MQKYDIIVIGTGSGGLSIGLTMHTLGFRVLFIERDEKNVGGECLNSGCVPSKALIHVSRLVHQANRAKAFGLPGGTVDFDKVTAYIRERQEIIRGHENADYFRKMGIDVVIGEAGFADKDAVTANGVRYTAPKIVIATGSTPARLQVPGSEDIPYFDNQNFFDIPQLPRQLLIVGGGPIALELGQALRRMGSEVRVVYQDDRVLSKEAPEVSQVLQSRLVAEGVIFHPESKVLFFPTTDLAVVEDRNKKRQEVAFDAVLVGIGRKIYLDGLQLENAGIETQAGKIVVDDYLRTTNKRVYVIGDAVGQRYFSHAAELQASIMAGNFFSPFKKKINYDHFSWVTFTDPEVATFGLTEPQLRERKMRYRKLVKDFADDDRAVIEDYRYGKLVLYTQGNAILGGTMIAPQAGEMIQELVLANSAGLTLKHLFDKTYPYPTASRVNKLLVLDKYLDDLRPWMKKGLRLLYKMQ
jgi:pyruvate/2-oxoglutarate dehydrogenase complex dihydrolipoamide dehydrogenase (E3) component